MVAQCWGATVQLCLAPWQAPWIPGITAPCMAPQHHGTMATWYPCQQGTMVSWDHGNLTQGARVVPLCYSATVPGYHSDTSARAPQTVVPGWHGALCHCGMVPWCQDHLARVPERNGAMVPGCQAGRHGVTVNARAPCPWQAPWHPGILAMLLGATAPQRRSATVPQCHSATVPQCHSATVPQCHSATVPQFHCAMMTPVPGCHSAMVPERHGAHGMVSAPQYHGARKPWCDSVRVPGC